MAKIQGGNYQIESLKIYSENNILDISPIFVNINIFESIYSPTISGYVTVLDAENIVSGVNSLPILGNEIIEIFLRVEPHNYGTNKEQNRTIKYYGRIIDIRNRTILRERSQSYEIHFVSQEAVLDRNIKISKSFKDKTIDSIVHSLFKDLSSEDTYEFEKTTGITNVVIPNWSPLYAINWLASRSISSEYNTPTFFFFQTLYNDGPTESTRNSYTKNEFRNSTSSKFWFLSLDDILAYPPRKEIYFLPANTLEGLIDDTLRYEYANASSYEIVNSFNTIENNATGLFNNTLITHNITNKEWKKIPFNYDKEFNKFQHLTNNKIYSGRIDKNNKKFDDKNYKESKIMMASLGTNENPNYLDQISSARISRLSSLNYFRIRIVLTGDATLESGDIVKFNMPSPESGGENKFDKYYDGNFLITSIRHTIDRTSYNITIECSKESLKESV